LAAHAHTAPPSGHRAAVLQRTERRGDGRGAGLQRGDGEEPDLARPGRPPRVHRRPGHTEERVNTYRELLDAEIGVAPPSTVDAERTIRRRRRIRRYRRAGGVASALVLRPGPAGPPRYGAPLDPTPASSPGSAAAPSPGMTDSEDGPPLIDEPAA